MKTRNTLIALAAIVCMSVACQKEQTPNGNLPKETYTYKIALSSEQPGVRSVLDGSAIKWEKDDQIGIYAGEAVNVPAHVASDLASLTLSLPSPLAEGDILKAYFPYVAGSPEATAVALAISPAQTVSGGIFDADAMPVVAEPVTVTQAIATGEENARLSFFNLGALLRFHIYSTDPTKGGNVQSISFQAATPLAGNATFDITADPRTAALAGLDAATVTTTLETALAVGSERATTAAQIPMVIAPGTYKGKVIITMDDASAYTYDIVNPFSVARSALQPIGVDLARANSAAIEGSGTEGDPYIVHNAADLKAKMAENAYITLGSNILLDDTWTSENFSGVLDGAGNTVSGLQVCFTNALSGTVKNVRFTDVAISDYKSSDNCKGVVAQTAANATISGVAAYGTMSTSTTAGTSGDYSGVGGVVGRASGTTSISNCYIEVDIPIVANNYLVGGILGNIRETNNITISNCTFAGSITGNGNYTKVGGILGRKTNVNQSSSDRIEDCLVSGRIAITGTGSNMLGGIFGALQGSNSGDYVGGLKIDRCAFTGSISAGAQVGGIAGVGPALTDCFVSGSIQATTTGSNGGSAGMVAAAKGNVTRCVTAGARISGTNQANFSTAGIICNRNANTPNATNCAVIGALLQNEGKAILGATSNLSASNNKWWGVKYLDDTDYVSGGTIQDGDAFTAAPTQADFEALGYNFTSVWKWNEAGYPELRNAGATVR